MNPSFRIADADGTLNAPRARRLRILLAPSAYYPNVGGIEEATRQLARAYTGSGHHVAVVTNRWPENVPTREVLDGVSVTRLALPLPALSPRGAARFISTAAPASVALIRHVRTERPDVVHVVGAGPQSAYVAMLRRNLDVTVVFTGQGELDFDARHVFNRSATLRLALRRMLSSADAVTACSSYVLRRLEAFGQIDGRRMVIPNGVDPDDFPRSSAAAEGSQAYVLGLGRLVPQKGFDVLLDAFAKLQHSDVTLVIAGDGDERERLERLARALRLGERVHFSGRVDRSGVATLLDGARVFALPSRGEPFGIALLEAMAAGVPCVATEAGGVAEFARHEQNALLVPVDDPDALAHALDRILRDEHLRRRLQERGRSTARELSWTRIASLYENLYREVIAASATSAAPDRPT